MTIRSNMKRKLLCILAVIVAGIPALAQDTNRILVKLKPGTAILRRANALSTAFLRSSQFFAGSRVTKMRALKTADRSIPEPQGLERTFMLELEDGADLQAAVQSFSGRPDVEYAEPDHIALIAGEPAARAAATIPGDPYFGSQWSLRNTGQSVNGIVGKAGADINAGAAWDLTKGDSNIIMAILDSGIASGNSEFGNRLVAGYDYVNGDADTADDNGHGTSVASIATASGNNSVLMAGVDWKCKIMPIKVIDRAGLAYYSNIVSGITYAVDHGAKVINISATGIALSQVLQEAVDYAYSHKVVIVAAMGNTSDGIPTYPASYSHVIAVGATNGLDLRANPFTNHAAPSGSNYGQQIDFVAPGDNILVLDYINSSQALIGSGTSFATPIVSGAVSLLFSIDPSFTFEQIYSLLQAGARDQVGSTAEDTPGWDIYYGWGRIDLYRSLQAAGILIVPSGGAVARSTPGTQPSARSGYGSLSVTSDKTPYGVAVFRFKQDGVVMSEVGVPSSPPTKSARVFIDFRLDPAGLDINTGLAIVNRNAGKATITYRLRNKEGEIIASGTGSLEGGAHLAKFVDQLKDIATGFDVPAGFQTGIQFGSLDVTSDQPVSIVALRLTSNQDGEPLLTSTPTADLTNAPIVQPLYFAHFVDGGGYTTLLMLMNTSDADESGTILFKNEAGQPLLVTRVGEKTDSVFDYDIKSGGVYIFRSDGSPAGPNPGSVQLTVKTGKAPAGAGVFSFSPGGLLVSESGVPTAAPTTGARIYIDQSAGHSTGVVVVNPGSSQITATLRAFEKDGVTRVGSAIDKTIDPYGHLAAFTYEFVSGLPDDFTGVLSVTSTSPFVALTLRTLVNETDRFLMTTFPVADANQPAPAPVVFPQVADGGGYTTQCILLSGGQASVRTLSFIEENGDRIPIEAPEASAP
jgi:thermitase